MARSSRRSSPTADPGGSPRSDATTERCRICGGELIAGSLVLPLLGQARFGFNLQGKQIETEVAAHMCAACGDLTLTARDPDRIRKAHDAVRRAGLARD